MEQYEARREHISSLALGGGGMGIGSFVLSFYEFYEESFRGKEKTQRNNSHMSHLFFRDVYARIAGLCFSVIVVFGMIFMK